MNKSGLYIMSFFFLLALSLFFSTNCTKTYLGRYLVYYKPTAEEGKKLPANTIDCAEKPYKFTDATSLQKLKDLPIIFKGEKYSGSLKEFLKLTKTNSFIVIRKDSILYEKYFNGYTRESINYSFSVTKSVTSSVLSVAIEKGYITSVRDKITDYLPEIDSEIFKDIRIENLIDMNAGFDFNRSALPWGDEAKSFYYTDIRKLTLEKFKKKEGYPPKFEYDNYNLFVLGLIIERATGQSITDFFEENIWRKIGTEYPAKWTLDSEKYRFEKLESGFAASAIDFARFAHLFIDGTNLKNKGILSKKWIDYTYTLDTIRVQNKDYYDDWHRQNKIAYHSLWYQFYNHDLSVEAILAEGILWQYLYINPLKKIIIVRLGGEGEGYDTDNYKLFENISLLTD